MTPRPLALRGGRLSSVGRAADDGTELGRGTAEARAGDRSQGGPCCVWVHLSPEVDPGSDGIQHGAAMGACRRSAHGEEIQEARRAEVTSVVRRPGRGLMEGHNKSHDRSGPIRKRSPLKVAWTSTPLMYQHVYIVI